LLIGGIIIILRGPIIHKKDPPVPLPEDHGQISRVVMQYAPGAGQFVIPIYSKFLSVISKNVQITWVVGKQADYDDLKTRLGKSWRNGHVVITGKEITTWSKDRFVAMHYPAHPEIAVACAPARTRSANPLRTNDQEVPYKLAMDDSHLFNVIETDVIFDGGDFLAAANHFFASPTIIEKNENIRYFDELTGKMKKKFSTEIIWLGTNPHDAPPHHIGMYLTVMGKYAAVSDVSLADAEVADHPEISKALQFVGGELDSKSRLELTRQLNNVAKQMKSLGYQVVRVPLMPSATPKAWMSYNNGIVETRDGNTIFYMPTFGAKALDKFAEEIFKKQIDCIVVPIDCSKIWHLGGSLHCLVNVVERVN
jgi:hypothetical protein